MLASKLRQRITLMRETQTRSPSGGVVKEWSEAESLWASVEPLSVKDKLTAQAAGSETTARIVIRYREGIDHSMRIKHKGLTYAMDGDPLADADSGNKYLTLMVKKLQPSEL